MRSKHQQLGLQNGRIAQRNVHGHLVTVKVCVKGRTNQGVELNRLAFNQFGLESLNTQAVQGWGTVQKNRMTFEHIFQNIPDHWLFAID